MNWTETALKGNDTNGCVMKYSKSGVNSTWLAT